MFVQLSWSYKLRSLWSSPDLSIEASLELDPLMLSFTDFFEAILTEVKYEFERCPKSHSPCGSRPSRREIAYLAQASVSQNACSRGRQYRGETRGNTPLFSFHA